MPIPTVRNINVWTLDRDVLTVSWEVEDTTEDLATYTVSVWRSEALGGPYQRVSMEMNAQDVFEFEDRAVNLLSKWREFYYRIRLTDNTSAYREFGSTPPRQVVEGADPGGVVMEAVPDLEALEAIRRFDLVLREYAGRRVLVLQERTWGQVCYNCWDSLKRRVKRSDCSTCFGTGRPGGFFHPQEAYAMKPPGQTSVQLTQLFEMQPGDQVMWFSSKPRMKPRDLVIDIDGRRWRCISVQRFEKGWSLTRQIAQVRLISRDQIEYSIPIGKDAWPVNTKTAGALRQHIRATDIESYYRAVQDTGLSGETLFPEKSEIATNLEDSNAESEP